MSFKLVQHFFCAHENKSISYAHNIIGDIMEILKVIVLSVVSAIALFVISKFIGHKQMSQLDLFDYITGITIGSIAAELATNLDKPWWKPMISMIVYGSITVLLSVVTEKFPKSRKYINGTPTIIMNNGKIYRSNLKKAKLELSEFLMMCRQEGYFDLSDIQTAIFECNGKLTVLPVSMKRPVNPEDISLSPKESSIQTEVIMDGRILDENLKRMGLDIIWLQRQIKEQGYSNPKDIFLGLCDENNVLTLFKNKE